MGISLTETLNNLINEKIESHQILDSMVLEDKLPLKLIIKKKELLGDNIMNNLTKEIKLIESIQQMDEKLMILALYNEFYNQVISFKNERITDYEIEFIETTFELACSMINLQKDAQISAKDFIKLFVHLLYKNPNIKNSVLSEVIRDFENKLDDLISNSFYVNSVNIFDEFSLEEKTRIITEFRSYLNKVFSKTIQYFEEDSSKDFREKVYGILVVRMEDYLKNSLRRKEKFDSIINNLNPALVLVVKNYLITKFRNGELRYMLLNNDTDDFQNFINFFNEMSDVHQIMVLFFVIYDISDFKDKKGQKREIQEYLKSTRFKYTKEAFSLVFACLKEVNNKQKVHV